MFHRVDIHAMLMKSAVGWAGEGMPAILEVNHKAAEINMKQASSVSRTVCKQSMT